MKDKRRGHEAYEWVGNLSWGVLEDREKFLGVEQYEERIICRWDGIELCRRILGRLSNWG